MKINFFSEYFCLSCFSIFANFQCVCKNISRTVIRIVLKFSGYVDVISRHAMDYIQLIQKFSGYVNVISRHAMGLHSTHSEVFLAPYKEK